MVQFHGNMIKMKKTTILAFLSLMVTGMVFSIVPSVAIFDRVVPFVYGSISAPSSFDPLGCYDSSSGDIILNTFEGLYSFDYSVSGMPVKPVLAEDFGVWNTDGTEWTISLRDDVTWHDGSAFTAEDVVWNFERLETLSN